MNAKPAALIVIDVQQAFDNPAWGRNNPGLEANLQALLETWRSNDWPIVLVRHDSVMEGSSLAPGHPGNAFKAGIDGKHDLLVTKSVNSAFYGTPNLEDWLRANEIAKVVITGIQTNYCCETTARMAGNLGFETIFAIDATATLPKETAFGLMSADELYRTTAINLDGEFATVLTTQQVLERL